MQALFPSLKPNLEGVCLFNTVPITVPIVVSFALHVVFLNIVLPCISGFSETQNPSCSDSHSPALQMLIDTSSQDLGLPTKPTLRKRMKQE